MGWALQALSRIGDELYIEPLPSGLTFRTVNTAKTAYAVVNFMESFFIDYSIQESETGGGPIKCKIAMKSCMGVFKFPAKQIEYCQINLDNDNPVLKFLMKCDHDIVRRHYLKILDRGNLDATYQKSEVPNKLKIQTVVLVEAIHNFQLTEDEVTIEASGQEIRLRNYIVVNSEKKLRTEIFLKPSEFEEYKIDSDTTLTFSMKELRAVVSFAECLDVPVNCSFETVGRPIVFSLYKSSILEANFVMATIEEDDDENLVSAERAPVTNTNTTVHPSGRVSITTNNHMQNEVEMAPLFNFMDSNSPVLNRNGLYDTGTHSSQTLTLQLNDSLNIRTCSPRPETLSSDPGSVQRRLSEVVPESPSVAEDKKSREIIVRKVFKRCFEATYNPAVNKPTKSQILAEDTDDE